MVEVSERRDDLLEKIADVLLADGVAESSLRPLAEKIGSSARLLIYHFETKEKLIKCALAVVRMRVEHSLQILAARKRPDSLKASLTMFWEVGNARTEPKLFSPAIRDRWSFHA